MLFFFFSIYLSASRTTQPDSADGFVDNAKLLKNDVNTKSDGKKK